MSFNIYLTNLNNCFKVKILLLKLKKNTKTIHIRFKAFTDLCDESCLAQKITLKPPCQSKHTLSKGKSLFLSRGHSIDDLISCWL